VYTVHSRFKHDDSTTRSNGVAGPFEKRDTAERALIALLQAGQATSGEIVDEALLEMLPVGTSNDLCCHYTDCRERHRLAEEDEKITCRACREHMGLPDL